MKQIDFYLLPTNSWMGCLNIVAQLIGKAYRKGHPITIALESHLIGDQLDNLLWTKKPETYIPHHYDERSQLILVAKKNAGASKVQIQCILDKPADGSWERLLQIVPNNTQLKSEARALYRHYQEQNIPIETHKL